MSSCPACNNGDLPTEHWCIICNKFLHVFKECSKPVPGEEEGSSEKRLCFDCDKGKLFLQYNSLKKY